MPQTASLTPAQAHYVLGKIIEEKRITPSEIARYVSEIAAEIKRLEARIAALRAAANMAAPAPAAAPQPARRRRRRRTADPKTAASQQLQGRYIAYLRQVPESRREKYREIVRTAGREAAIKKMRADLGR
jgi:anti-sigma-K factor RskA